MKNETKANEHENVHENTTNKENPPMNGSGEKITIVDDELTHFMKKYPNFHLRLSPVESRDYVRESDEDYDEEYGERNVDRQESLAEADWTAAGYDYKDDYYYKSKSKGEVFYFLE